MLFVAAQPVSAATPPNNLLDKDSSGTINAGDEIVGVAGSDTLEFVTRDIIATLPTNVKNHVFNIDPGPHQATPLLVPADAFCANVTYDATETDTTSDGDADGKLFPPNGSGAGRTALDLSANPSQNWGSVAIDTGNGCIDVARSSGFSSAIPTQEFYGFALDSVSWGSTSLNAPTNLSVQQLRDIYACRDETAAGLTVAQQAIDGDTKVNNWAEVGGALGKISRVLPQLTSGTRAFFISNVLANVTPPDGLAAQGCDDVLLVQENAGNELTTGANLGRYNEYVLPYSAGKWVFQVTRSSNPTEDIRSGVRIGALTRDAAETCPTLPAVPGGFTGENDNGALTVRFDGAGYSLNSATLVCFVSKTGVTANNQGDTTLTAAPGTFDASMIGLAVQGPFINDGTVVSGVDGSGSTLTILPGANSAAAGGVTGTISIGIPVVSEFNPNITSASSNKIYPGVRELFHVLDTRQGLVSYNEARQLFGFEATTANKSPLCEGSNEGEIVNNGFLPLAPVTNHGTTGTTCRLLP